MYKKYLKAILILIGMALYTSSVHGQVHPCPPVTSWECDEAIVSDAVCELVSEEEAGRCNHRSQTLSAWSNTKQTISCTLTDFSLSVQFSILTSEEDSDEQKANSTITAAKKALSKQCFENDNCKNHYNCKQYRKGTCR